MQNSKLEELESILLRSDDSLERAIRVIDEGGRRIALVVDGTNKLLGTLTDGDIRRALINHVQMDAFVIEIMNAEPITSLVSCDRSKILALMKESDLLHVPIVDEEGFLVGMETLQDLITNKRYENTVFLMAGGFGSRLRPLTNDIPKPLLRIGGIPILETIINQFISAGFYNFYISTHYKADMLSEYFGDGASRGVNIQYIHETKPLGTAGSLGLLPECHSGLPIFVMNADLLTKVDFLQMLSFHGGRSGLATMAVREYEFQVPYGVVTVNNQNITSIVEKPTQRFFVNSGIYLLEPSLLKKLDGNSYLDMPVFMEEQIQAGESVNVFPIYEYWLDIGSKEDYDLAFLSHRKGFV